MADFPSFEVPPQMRDFAESSLIQARRAFANFIEVARRTTDTMQGSTEFARTQSNDMFARGLDHAEQNVRAALDLAKKLAAARTGPAATQIQSEFVRERFAALQAQAQELSGLAQGAFQQGAERTRAAMQQGADATRKAVEQGADAARQAGQEVQQAAEQHSH